MPQLHIKQQSGKIGLDIKKAETIIRQKKSNLDIKQKSGELTVKQDLVKINVDNYPPRFDLGYKNIKDELKDIKKEGQKTALKAISDYARTGDKLMDFKKTSLAEISYNKAFKDDKKKVKLGWKRGPKIEVSSPKLKMKYNPQFPIIRSQMNLPHINAEWGKVDIKLLQKPELDIEVIGQHVNKTV